jgi:hypothetical protein
LPYPEAGKLYLLPYDEDAQSALEAAGISDINKRVVKKKWVALSKEECEKILETEYNLPKHEVQRVLSKSKVHNLPDTPEVRKALSDALILFSRDRQKKEEYIDVDEADYAKLPEKVKRVLRKYEVEAPPKTSTSTVYSFDDIPEVRKSLEQAGFSNINE